MDCSLKDWGKFARQIWGGVAGGERNGIPRGGKSTCKGRDGCFFATQDSNPSSFVGTDHPEAFLSTHRNLLH